MTHYAELPPLALHPAHDAVVSTLSRLRQSQVERFLARCTGSHAAMVFLREVLYWLSPSNKAPDRPRSTVYRNGSYWMARTQKQWFIEHFFSRSKLETIYQRCDGFIEIDHFMFGRQRQTHYRINFDKLREEIEHDEILQACLQSDLNAAKSRTAPSESLRNPVCATFRSPSVNSLGDSVSSLEITSECSPSAPSGAAAPEPPPPARSQSKLDSVEAALASATEKPEKPEVKTFRQAQAILQAAEGASITEKLRRVIPYGERTRKVVGYLLIWQAECEAIKQSYRLCEAHFLQAGELAENEEVPLVDFCGVLRAAWEAVPNGTYDPLFMCSHHSKKFTLFCKHFRRMEKELNQ